MSFVFLKSQIYFSVIFLLFACSEELVKELPKHIEEQRLLIGKWEQKTDLDTTTVWEFTTAHLKWGNFTHSYKMNKSDLYISGLKYQLLYQSSDSIQLISKRGDTLLLERLGE